MTEERAAARLAWALKYDGLPIEFWKRWRWSDECSIERGKGGKWEFVYRRRGKFSGVILSLLCVPITNVYEQVKHYAPGQFKEYLQKHKQLCFGQRLDTAFVRTWCI